MKIYLTLLFLVILNNLAYSQNTFEGVIKYKTDVKGHNPVMVGMMPDSFVFLFKNKDVRIMLFGGIISAMIGEIVSKGDSNISFMLDYAEKIAYRFDPYKYDKSIKVDIEETGKIKRILNKKCTLYRISYDNKDGNVVSDIWMTDELPVAIPRNNPMGKFFVFSDLEGFPLLIESKIKYQSTQFDIVIEAVSIIERSIPDDEFLIPPKFKVVPLLAPSDIGF